MTGMMKGLTGIKIVSLAANLPVTPAGIARWRPDRSLSSWT